MNKRSEVWFARYATEHGLEGADRHQPDLGGTAEPDFRVQRDGATAIVEVKEFETSVLHQRLKEAGPRNVVTLDAETELATIRHKLGKAAKKQLRPYAERGEPLVICLANPNGIWVDLDADDVLAAMYGDPAYTFHVDTATGAAVDNARFKFDRNGTFVDSHRYVSAVLTLHRGTLAAEAVTRWEDENRHRWAGIEDRRKATEAMLEIRNNDEALRAAEAVEGDFYFVRVYESKWAALGEAARLAPELFNGPRDEFWQVDRETGTIARLKGKAVDSHP
jgi:hypothetical protein